MKRLNNTQMRVKKEPKIPVMELFGPTIQGEGLMTGTVTHFLRTGGCGLNCKWCDSLFAVTPKLIKKHRIMMTTAAILDVVEILGTVPYITLTGGDPCLHKTLGDLIVPFNAMGLRVAVETQGQLFPDWLETVDVVTFSPKGPSSGNAMDDIRPLYDWLEAHSPRRTFKVCVKVVVFDKKDFEYAMALYDTMHHSWYDAFYFTAGTPMITPTNEEHWASERVMGVLGSQKNLATKLIETARRYQFNDKVHMGSQQHVLLWPNKDKGV